MDKRKPIMTLEEIAAELNLSKSLVFQTLQSGLHKLRQDPRMAAMYDMAKLLDANRREDAESR